ncbi:alcohol dehydrogenase catalytic domain-containing protein [Rhizobium mongolense]|uniref:alcohol dehydrogenase catalytic domain-containing protein n=1 Tax=Rhizobium mongolense TaxID=57676 RepID=UPI0018DE9203
MSHLKHANSTSKPIGPGRALRLHVYGGPEPLSVDPVSVPDPGPGKVLVEVRAAGVNGLDWKIRDGHVRNIFKLELPATLGIEMAGVVLQTGPGVTGRGARRSRYGRARSMRRLCRPAAHRCRETRPDARRSVRRGGGGYSGRRNDGLAGPAGRGFRPLWAARADSWRGGGCGELRRSIRQGGGSNRLCHGLDQKPAACAGPGCGRGD